MPFKSAKKNSSKKKQRRPIRPSEVERESRKQIVEFCLAAGKVSRAEIQAEFAERGIDCHERTIDSYIKDVRERLAEEDDKQRTANRKQIAKSLAERELQMLGLLEKNKVVPKWRDLVNILKLRIKLYETGMLSTLAPPTMIIQANDEDTEGKSAEQLDQMIHAMIKKTGESKPAAAVDKTKGTVH